MHSAQCEMTDPYSNQNPYQTIYAPRVNTSIAGQLSYNMNKKDREKISKALDQPIGKVTRWRNEDTGISYSVVATEKVEIEGNNFCRRYRITSERHDQVREVNKVACIDQTSGGWRPVG